jgi:signal transduction histidine kinase
MQVLTNLLTNSIKFTSEGSVTMGVKVQRETDDTIQVQFVSEYLLYSNGKHVLMNARLSKTPV